VSPDEPSANRAFAEKFKFPFPLLSDPSKRMMTAYGAYGEKMMYGIRKQGVIRSTVWIGPDSVVKKHWRKVPDAAEHPAKVLEALQAR
jgi:peroxiredoxin Q/BCP